MKSFNASSDIVLAGNNFISSIFEPNRFYDLLGEEIQRSRIITPLFSQQEYDNGYKVLVNPNRFEISYSGSEYLPITLSRISKSVTENICKVYKFDLIGFGINFNIEVFESNLEMTGLEYCQKYFFNLPNFNDIFSINSALAHTGKVIFLKDNVKYIFNFEPNFRSNGKNLHLSINAHQDIIDCEEAMNSIEKYHSIKDYIKSVIYSLFNIDVSKT